MVEQPIWQKKLEEIVHLAKTIGDEMNTDCEKIQIAMTGVLKLLSGEKTQMLKGLGGRQEDLQRYMLELVSDLREKSTRQLTRLCSELEDFSGMVLGNE